MQKQVDVPTLDHDLMMRRKFGHEVHACGRGERRVIAALVAHMVAREWLPVELYDGEERSPVTDVKSAMELIFNLDDCYLYFRRGDGPKRWVRIVLGNSPDEVIGDYNASDADGFAPAVDAFIPSEYL